MSLEEELAIDRDARVLLGAVIVHRGLHRAERSVEVGAQVASVAGSRLDDADALRDREQSVSLREITERADLDGRTPAVRPREQRLERLCDFGSQSSRVLLRVHGRDLTAQETESRRSP